MRYILTLFLITLSTLVYSQELPGGKDYPDQENEKKDFAGINDTLTVASRPFSSADINRLKSDPDLNYVQPPTLAESLWDRFKQWIAWFFENLFDQMVTTDLGRLLLYTLAGILLIVVIMMLLKVNAFRVFYSGADKPRLPYQVFHENIHEMDFESLIQEASDKSEFRLATRLIFLYALKLLSDKHLIDFNPGKTNHDFVEELKVSDLKSGLSELSYYFEYAWYGNFLITDSQFQRIKNTFIKWRTHIK